MEVDPDGVIDDVADVPPAPIQRPTYVRVDDFKSLEEELNSVAVFIDEIEIALANLKERLATTTAAYQKLQNSEGH